MLIVTPKISVLGAQEEKNGGTVLQELYEGCVTANGILTLEMEAEKENLMKGTYIDSVMKVNEEYSGC